MSRLSIRMKILIVIMLLFTVAFGAVFGWFYQYATDLAMNNLRQNLMLTASTAADLINAREHTRIYEEWEDADTEYERISDQLQTVLDANPQARAIYTMMPSPGEAGQLLFVVDLEADMDFVGTEYESETPEMLAALDGPTAETEPVEDEYGTTLSGYAPIRNAAGKSVGIVGVDVSADDVLEMQVEIMLVSAVIFILASAGIFLAAIVLSGAITKPLRVITGAARTLEADEPFEPERLSKVARRKDELGQLARVFSEMIVQVQQREQKLKQEVVKLRIEIDEAKRAKQVEEIAGTDYFRDLQKKARDMRKQQENDQGT